MKLNKNGKTGMAYLARSNNASAGNRMNVFFKTKLFE
jgi:hypothetical protein